MYNIVRTVFHGAEAGDNPWEASEGLEWTLSSPPPYHSFEIAPDISLFHDAKTDDKNS